MMYDEKKKKKSFPILEYVPFSCVFNSVSIKLIKACSNPDLSPLFDNFGGNSDETGRHLGRKEEEGGGGKGVQGMREGSRDARDEEKWEVVEICERRGKEEDGRDVREEGSREVVEDI